MPLLITLDASQPLDFGSRHEGAARDPNQLELACTNKLVEAGSADAQDVAGIRNPVGLRLRLCGRCFDEHGSLRRAGHGSHHRYYRWFAYIRADFGGKPFEDYLLLEVFSSGGFFGRPGSDQAVAPVVFMANFQALANDAGRMPRNSSWARSR